MFEEFLNIKKHLKIVELYQELGKILIIQGIGNSDIKLSETCLNKINNKILTIEVCINMSLFENYYNGRNTHESTKNIIRNHM
ncbi:hypothetical protein RIR_jg764.t1 [Rhizophagus irregularis DAOM 181602=DAOM 197198]|nr:hypothetical protein RIR_jg764.t1 [Rhizophagus irregularis DAOM 181602=DAOM 197198]